MGVDMGMGTAAIQQAVNAAASKGVKVKVKHKITAKPMKKKDQGRSMTRSR